jgi:hypothetical protein
MFDTAGGAITSGMTWALPHGEPDVAVLPQD